MTQIEPSNRGSAYHKFIGRWATQYLHPAWLQWQRKLLKRYFRRHLVLLSQLVLSKMWIVQYKVFFCSHVYFQAKWWQRSKGNSRLDQLAPKAANARMPIIESLLKTTRLGATAVSVVIELHEKPQNLTGRSGSSTSSDLLTWRNLQPKCEEQT